MNLGKPQKVTVPGPAGAIAFEGADLGQVKVDAKVTKAGDLKPTTVNRTLDQTYVVAGLIYGLVNVRTDGEKILCATLNEKKNSWETKVIRSRF